MRLCLQDFNVDDFGTGEWKTWHFFPAASSVDSILDRPHRMMGTHLEDLGCTGGDRMFRDLPPLYPEWAVRPGLPCLTG
jgi:hypothetical protein